MTIPRYQELKKYWRKNPPASMLLAWKYGYKPPEDQLMTPQQMYEMVQSYGGSLNG